MRRVRFGALVTGAALAFVAIASRAAAGDEAPPSSAPAGTAPASGAALEAKKQFERGLVLREEGKWVDAAQAFGKSLTSDDSSWESHVRYQEAGCAAGEKVALVAEYDSLLKGKPDDAMLRLHRLRLDPAAARIDQLNAGLKADPGRREFLVELGRAQLTTGDVAGGKKTFETLWAKCPDTGEILGLSVEALRRSGDLVEARKRLEGALKQVGDLHEAILDLARIDLLEAKHEDAVKHADTVLQLRPSYIAAMLVKSEALSRLGKAEDSKTTLEAAIRVNPEEPDAQLAMADLIAKGAKEEGLKKAVALYKKVLGTRGANLLRGWYGLGWAQERLNLLPDAAQSYREASLLSQNDAGVMNSIGVVFLKQKKFEDAKLNFKKAIDIDRTSPEAYENMAAVSEEQADWNEAIKWHQKVLALKGQDKNVRALLNSAFDYEAISDYKKAENLLEKVRDIRPDDSEVVTYYGDNQFFQHKWKNAIKAYEAAAKLDDKNRFAWRGLGLALVGDGQPEDAVGPLEKAKALKKDDPATLIALGDIYSDPGDQKDLKKALENYEAYLAAGGKDGDVPGLIEAIKKELEQQKK